MVELFAWILYYNAIDRLDGQNVLEIPDWGTIIRRDTI
jgi:hypothetical protein